MYLFMYYVLMCLFVHLSMYHYFEILICWLNVLCIIIIIIIIIICYHLLIFQAVIETFI